MKQPELGKKITELRKSKGLTQEELVEKCNISVRTIQRIETGDVTPRSYTIKTILSALDYDLDEISDQENKNWIKKIILAGADLSKPSEFLTRQLNIAVIFGIIYFVLGFLEGAADYSRYQEGQMILGSAGYVVMKVLVLISFIFFQRGFVIIGGLFNNYLLKVTAMILISASILLITLDIVTLFSNILDPEAVMFGASLMYGAISIIFGISLLRLRALGRVSSFAGAIEIIAGCFFLTIFLAFLGLLIQMPAELFQIILIFKAIEIVKAEKKLSFDTANSA
ncbi:MAG: helix-turn-helix domain-containing protein [Candidatus Cyclobacteriaceae bacterium M2_1C_046]